MVFLAVKNRSMSLKSTILNARSVQPFHITFIFACLKKQLLSTFSMPAFLMFGLEGSMAKGSFS